MKQILGVVLSLSCCCVFAQTSQVVEFNLLQSQVIYQLNRSTGSLFGIIKDVQGGICLHKMDFKSKDSASNNFLYERTDSDRGKQYYQRFEVNLLANQVNIFTSIRNRSSIIPITQKDCTANSCTNIAVIPQCNY